MGWPPSEGFPPIPLIGRARQIWPYIAMASFVHFLTKEVIAAP
jgi:hypothetical protein